MLIVEQMARAVLAISDRTYGPQASTGAFAGRPVPVDAMNAYASHDARPLGSTGVLDPHLARRLLVRNET